jgi:hypothetical protein
MRRLVSVCALLATGVFGCGKTGADSADKTPNMSTGGGNSGTSGASATGGSAPMKPGQMPGSACTVPGPSPGPAPLSALDNFEVNRSLRALFGSTLPSDGLLWLVEDQQSGRPFSNTAQDIPPRPMHALAQDLALQLSKDATATQAFSHCRPLAPDDQTCAAAFIESFVARAYRRPLDKEDRDDMKAVFAEGQRLTGDFAGGVRAVVEVALQSPEFLYLVEAGAGEVADTSVELTGSETAARLAYFLTAAPPDTELAAVAAKGALSADTLEDQARRLLGSPASRELVRHFYGGMLRLRSENTNNDLGYTAQIASLAQEESERFVEDVTFDGAGTFAALLTEPSTWVNGPLAQFYGLPGVAGADFQKVALDPSRRAGVLTQAAFLRAHAHAASTSPVHRGLAVLRELLCVEIPPPPVDIGPLSPPEAPEPATIRQRLTVATQGVECQSCHDDINPLGFAFEHYDAVGKWQDTDNGLAVDASGVLAKTDAAGPFADAIELLKRIADSDDAKACFVGHWLAQAYRRPAEPADACTVEQLSQAFADSDGNLVELMVSLAKSDNFRYRLKSELTP